MKSKHMKIYVDVRLSFILNDKNFKYVKRILNNLRKNGIKLSDPKVEVDGFN